MTTYIHIITALVWTPFVSAAFHLIPAVTLQSGKIHSSHGGLYIRGQPPLKWLRQCDSHLEDFADRKEVIGDVASSKSCTKSIQPSLVDICLYCSSTTVYIHFIVHEKMFRVTFILRVCSVNVPLRYVFSYQTGHKTDKNRGYLPSSSGNRCPGKSMARILWKPGDMLDSHKFASPVC